MQFSAQVTSVTREAIVPKVYDNVLNGNVGSLRLLGNAEPWKSGYRYDVPIKYAKSTQGGVIGLNDKLSTSRSTNRTKMQFEPKAIAKPVVINDFEKTLNKGDMQVLELLATEFDSIAQDLSDDLGGELYTGTGAGDRWDSLINAADDSTNFTTYGSLSRSTYTVLNGYLSTGVGALALPDMSSAFNATKHGDARASLILTTKTGFTAYEGLLQPTVRMNVQASGFPVVTRTGMAPSRAALGGDIGFDALMYRGAPVAADEKCTSGEMHFVTEKYFGLKGIDLDGYEKPNISGDKVDGPQNIPVPRGFNWTGLRVPTDQLASVGHLVLAGNFISESPRSEGRLTGITG